MDNHEVVYMGGPRHGEREAREGDALSAPPTLEFPTFTATPRLANYGVGGRAVYRLAPLADTPGALAYAYDEQASL